MSLRKRIRHNEDNTVDMTPMLDIVFILLIFFVVTAIFLDETGLNFTQNHNEAGIRPDRPAIHVQVTSQNIVRVEQETTELSNVAYAIESQLVSKPNAMIIVTAHYNADLDPIIQIKDQMELAGRSTRLKISREEAM